MVVGREVAGEMFGSDNTLSWEGAGSVMAERAFSERYDNREFHQQFISDGTIFNNLVK